MFYVKYDINYISFRQDIFSYLTILLIRQCHERFEFRSLQLTMNAGRMMRFQSDAYLLLKLTPGQWLYE